MTVDFTWIQGPTQSGKTARLLKHIATQARQSAYPEMTGAVFLGLAANGDNRLTLLDRITLALPPEISVHTATPIGFIQSEVVLFWPLLVEALGLNPQFPLHLRPETEQDLATQLWQPQLDQGAMAVPGWTAQQIVRRSLDFLQLAAQGGIPAEDLALILPEGIPPGLAPNDTWVAIGEALVQWRDRCLAQGFLTYGITTELYGRHLIHHPTYLAKLPQRFQGFGLDDLDEYPRLFQTIVETFLNLGITGAVTWNPNGKVRLGVGADPDALEALRAQVTLTETLTTDGELGLVAPMAEDWVQMVRDPTALPTPSAVVQVIQTTSRGELLRATAAAVITGVKEQGYHPSEIAVIGPGFDAIARYTLSKILINQGIPVESLNDQRPLVSSPLIRAILTLIPFVYDGLGRQLDPEAVAEMLTVLSQTSSGDPSQAWVDRVQIDPVRAELIVDHCFHPDSEQPKLLAASEFPRWDRLGYQAVEAYDRLRQWLARQRQARQQRLLTSPVMLLDRAINTFLWQGVLPYDQLAALRELMETAQHFWDVERRRQQQQRSGADAELSPQAEDRFLTLLHQGIVTANPFPVKPLNRHQQGVILSTVFQYRSQRRTHRWQLWLDAGSPRWLTGTDALFGYPLFLRSWSGRPWTLTFLEQVHEERLERILRDLLGRTTERITLCHSDLAVNGQEQTGPLIPLLNSQS